MYNFLEILLFGKMGQRPVWTTFKTPESIEKWTKHWVGVNHHFLLHGANCSSGQRETKSPDPVPLLLKLTARWLDTEQRVIFLCLEAAGDAFCIGFANASESESLQSLAPILELVPGDDEETVTMHRLWMYSMGEGIVPMCIGAKQSCVVQTDANASIAPIMTEAMTLVAHTVSTIVHVC